MWSIYCLFIARINKLVDAYICARAHFEGENERKRRECWSHAWCCSGCRTFASRNKWKQRSVLSHWWCYIDDVPKVPTTPFFLFFFVSKRGRQEEKAKEVFCFFKVFSSRQLGFWCSFPNKRKTKNNKISLGQFIVYWQFFDLEEGPEWVFSQAPDFGGIHWLHKP